MKLLGNSATRTIDDYVKRSSENYLQFQNSSHYTVVDGEIMEDFNIFRDRYYDTIMNQYTVDRILTEEEYQKYKYRPKRLSSDIYGTIDYWYILLMINKMSSTLQFTKKRIKVLSIEGTIFIKNLYKKEESELIRNKNEIKKKLQSA
jgi:archaellum component FlaG (FlaF/FlaG flagellin family)